MVLLVWPNKNGTRGWNANVADKVVGLFQEKRRIGIEVRITLPAVPIRHIISFYKQYFIRNMSLLRDHIFFVRSDLLGVKNSFMPPY